MKIKTLISASLLTIFFNSYAEIPKAQEEWFALTEAKNLAAVEKKFGIFNAKQREFLEKHRFLLVPRKNLDNEVNSDDEMLAAFDSMVEPFSYYDYDEKNQHKSKFDAAGARLFNPDIFQHALHMYFYRRMRFLEEKNLAPALENMLGNLITVALKECKVAEKF